MRDNIVISISGENLIDTVQTPLPSGKTAEKYNLGGLLSLWARMMPTGLFNSITPNPLLAVWAGLDFPRINWSDMAGRARGLSLTD